MKIERPKFELTRVFSDGTREPPEIVPVTEMPWDTKMSRRGALGFGLTATAVLIMLGACDRSSSIFSRKTVKEVDLEDLPDAQRKAPDAVLQAHKQAVSKLTFSADSTTLTSSANDGTVKQWSVPDGKLLATVADKTPAQFWSDVTPDGKTLIIQLLNNEIAFWAPPQKNSLKKIPGWNVPAVPKFALSPDGKVFAFAQGGIIKLFSVPEGKPIATLTGDEQKDIAFLSFTPNGKTLISGAAGEELKLWSVPDGNLSGKLEGSDAYNFNDAFSAFNPSSLQISPAGDQLAMLASGGIRHWSLTDAGKSETKITTFDVQALMFTPDGKTLVTAGSHYPTPDASNPPPDLSNPPAPSFSYALRLLSFPEMELLTVGKMKLPAYADLRFTKTAFTPDGKTLAVAFQNGNDVWLLSLPDLKAENILKGTKLIQCLAVSPDGKILATGDYGGTIMLWDLEKKEFLSYLFDKTANTSAVKGMAFNVKDKVTGRTITYTLPCGSPIPPGAICTCNCVPGTYTTPKPQPRVPRIPRGGVGGGTYCTCNKVCVCIPVPSDRELKKSFETTDPFEILELLAEIPIQRWTYKWDDSNVKHIGPMAQDFAAAFNVGDDNRHIHPVDAQGVAFAAVQALYQLLKEKNKTTQNLEKQLREHGEENQRLKFRIERLEQLIKETK